MTTAIEKINSEIQVANNPYVQIIGQFLINKAEEDPAAAEKILTEGKTIQGSLSVMATEAKKKAVNGMAMLTDEEGFAIVLDYFGIEISEKITKPQLTVIETPKIVTKKSKSETKLKENAPDGQLDIFDLLGGAAGAN